MKLIFAREPFPKSFSKAVFLAGPPPRSAAVESWRPAAIECLHDQNYDGVVFIPEDRSGAPEFDYAEQIEWEETGLRLADSIVFWIPRDVKTLPGFTTNIEWGTWQTSGKAVLGHPASAEKMRYLDHYAEKNQIPWADTLDATIAQALKLIGDGAHREGGELDVPLTVWRQPQFQQWYQAQLKAGNRLDAAEWMWNTRPRMDGSVFCHIIRPEIFIPSEERSKTNEVVVSRPDISSVLAYHPGETLEQCRVVLVREFRTSAMTPDGFVRELPGGSSPDHAANALQTAADELAEETGFRLPPDRFVSHEPRQCMATMLSHRGHLFSVELTDDEIESFKNREGQRFGENDSERTYVEVRTLDSIFQKQDVDWTHLGMILSILGELIRLRIDN